MRDRTEADDIVQGSYNRALLDLILPPMRLAAKDAGYALAVHGSAQLGYRSDRDSRGLSMASGQPRHCSTLSAARRAARSAAATNTPTRSSRPRLAHTQEIAGANPARASTSKPPARAGKARVNAPHRERDLARLTSAAGQVAAPARERGELEACEVTGP